MPQVVSNPNTSGMIALLLHSSIKLINQWLIEHWKNSHRFRLVVYHPSANAKGLQYTKDWNPEWSTNNPNHRASINSITKSFKTTRTALHLGYWSAANLVPRVCAVHTKNFPEETWPSHKGLKCWCPVRSLTSKPAHLICMSSYGHIAICHAWRISMTFSRIFNLKTPNISCLWPKEIKIN